MMSRNSQGVLSMSKCQWIGEGEGCQQLAQPGSSYCSQHHQRVYQVGSNTRRKKDQRRADQVWDLVSAFNEAAWELEQEGFDLAAPRWDHR
jgi:hypothetical protein